MSDIVAELRAAVREAHDTGSSSVSVDLPTGDDLLDEIDRLHREVAGVRESLEERDQACDDAQATAAMHAATLKRLQTELAARDKFIEQNHESYDRLEDQWRVRHDNLATYVRRYLRAQSRGNFNLANQLYQVLKELTAGTPLKEADDE